MNATVEKTYGSYHFGSLWDLTDQNMSRFIEIFNAPTDAVDSPLGGRSAVTIAQLEGIGWVVIKHYTRGGFIRYIVKRNYIKCGKTRSQLEYQALQNAARLGVNVPEPIAYAYHGNLFYRAWLVTREIPQQNTLAELSKIDEMQTRIAMKEVVNQIETLIRNNIHHADLHPGNILVNNTGRVFILDFDKSSISRGSRNKLRDRYLRRWRRAVSKHRLPGMLSEMMRTGLQSDG
jgi:3-deoxy-D-manno-octulosonic acid kinase